MLEVKALPLLVILQSLLLLHNLLTKGLIMASLKITRVGGEVVVYKITPAIEYAFEVSRNIGFHKAFRESERQTDLYWLSWECLRSNGVTVNEFNMDYLKTLVEVAVIDDESPNV